MKLSHSLSSEALIGALLWATGVLSFDVETWQLPAGPRLAPRATMVYDTQSFVNHCKPQLSKGAQVYVSGQPEFANATDRWDESREAEPGITVVVKPATEADVANTIKAANRCNMPFLAVSGGHGSISSLSHVKNGVQIWMRGLNSVKVNPDGQTATMGGGVIAREVVDALWAKNKQTVTGACDCTGVAGPMLGGGHGWLQGQKGLIADQLVSANLVLADGSQITVSEKQHADLYWALKGAGHNFGILTSFTNKIYDVKQRQWSYEEFVFTQDKLEALYKAMNDLTAGGAQPPEMVQYSVFLSMPAVDPKQPVIAFYILWGGPPADIARYSRPFHAIGPAVAQAGAVDYPSLSDTTGNGIGGPACAHGSTWMRFPINLDSYHVPSVRKVYGQFRDLLKDHPATNNSIFLFEGYSTQGVKRVRSDSTAYPNRGDNLLVAPAIAYKPDPKLDPIVTKAGQAMRATLLQGSGSRQLRSYVNYAHGDESLQDNYGHESWRVPRLQRLKQQYDPHNRFAFYAPLAK